MDCIERDCIRDYVAGRNLAIKASVDSHICGALNVDPTNEIYQASRHYTAVGITVVSAASVAYGGVKFLSNINKLAKPVLGSIGHLNTGSNVSTAQRLNRTVIKEYLSNVNKLSRKQIISDLESIGLSVKGKNLNRPWLEFVDRRGNVCVKIHPPDRITKYDHLHIYDRKGKSLNSELKIVKYDSVEAHIEYGGNI